MTAFNPEVGGYGPVSRQKTLANLFDSQLSRSIYFLILISAYRVLLDLSYEYVSEVYGYQGLFYNGRTPGSLLLSWVLFIVSVPLFKKVFDSKTPSGIVLSILILFSVVPTISVISFRSDYNIEYIALLTLYWVTLMGIWLFFPKIQFESFRNFESGGFHNIVLVILCFSVLIYSYINTGIRFHFSVIDVYDLRSEARNFSAPFPLNYLVSLADNLLPFFAIYALFRKKYLIFAATLFVIYVNFSIAGTKQILFTFAAGFAGYYFISRFSDSYRLILASVILLVIGLIEGYLLSGNTIITLFAYRVLFIPAELHFTYYSYFQMNEILYFSQSILKWLWTTGNQDNIQFILGEYAIGDYSARANNGLFSDAYMNLGVIGIFVFPVFIALFLRLLDGAAAGLPERIMFVVFIYVSFVLLGMTLTSALLTSGLLFLIPFLYSIPRDAR